MSDEDFFDNTDTEVDDDDMNEEDFDEGDEPD